LASSSIFTSNLDIGSPSPTGSGSYNSSSTTYTVAGGGADIWGASDQFHFLSQSLAGNGTIIARVESVQNTNVSAKGGVMFRNSTAANAAYAFAWVKPNGNVVFETRAADGASSIYSNTVSGVGLPVWVRLVRSGNQFSASYSTNGASWTQIGTAQTVTMANNAQTGLAVTSHNNGTLCTAVFSNVSVISNDTTRPTVTINQAAGQVDPTNSSTINYTVIFSESVSDFATGEVTLSGTAGAAAATITGSGTTYNVAVSGMTASGTVIASLLAGVAHDAANNPSWASTSTDNAVTFSPPPPDADFDGDGDTDGGDFLAWQRGFGIQAPNASKADGDADNDLDVDDGDLGIWRGQFGTDGAMAAAAALAVSIAANPPAVAEPAAIEAPPADASQPLSAELVDAAISWGLAARPRLKVRAAADALGAKARSDRLTPSASRAPSAPWNAGSDYARHLMFGRADEHADAVFNWEGEDGVEEPLIDRRCAPSARVRL
jgi:regulation of enolase protein 1 (concanavalin A-like superfamily)